MVTTARIASIPPLWGRPPGPIGAQALNWDPLAELATTLVASPVTALAGAGIGFLIAGPVGAARGAMMGAALPATVFSVYELHLINPWWGKQPNHSNLGFVLGLMAFPAVSAVGYGIGFAVAGAAGAAWGTLTAAAAPAAAIFFAGASSRWWNKPLDNPTDPVLVPIPAPDPRSAPAAFNRR